GLAALANTATQFSRKLRLACAAITDERDEAASAEQPLDRVELVEPSRLLTADLSLAVAQRHAGGDPQPLAFVRGLRIALGRCPALIIFALRLGRWRTRGWLDRLGVERLLPLKIRLLALHD